MGSRKHLVSDPRVCQTRGGDWKIKRGSGLVDKEFSVLFVIDTNSEIRKVNNRFNKNQLVSLISKIYFCHKIIHVSDSSSVHHQERIHSTLNNGIQGVPGEMDKTSGECSLC